MSRETQAGTARQAKREQFVGTARPGRGRRAALVAAAMVLVGGAAAYVLFRPGPGDGEAGPPAAPPVVVFASDSGIVRVPLAELEGGQARFFEHAAKDGGRVRFFAIKGSDGTHRAALDACEVCYFAKKGYFQRGDEMVCRQCGQSFPSALINEASGGCHPIGVPRRVEGGHLVVNAADLESINAEYAARAARAPRRPARHGR